MINPVKAKRWVLASGNPGKLKEIQTFLQGSGIQLLAQSEFELEAVEESGVSFVENAILKARHAAAGSGLPALADDSGLCVQALHGAPGIYSARYAGQHGDSQANNQKLLQELAGVQQRSAYFYCVLVWLAAPQDPKPLIFEGIWPGEILTEPRGQGGFGYDPIFLLPELGLSAAQLSLAQKNRLSHRAQALGHLAAALAS